MKHPLLILLALGTSGLQAAPLASDNFDSPDADAVAQEAKSSLTWTAKNQNFVFRLVEDTDGLASGKSLSLSMPFHYGGLYVPFPQVSLERGQKLKAALRFRFSTPPPPVTNGLRFGLIDSKSDNPADGSAPGYWIMTNPGSSENDACAFFEAGTDTGLGGGQDLEQLGKNAMSSAAETGPHNLVFSISRGDDGIEISWQIDGGDVQTRQDPLGKTTAFNAFALAVGDISQVDLLLDDLEISKE